MPLHMIHYIWSHLYLSPQHPNYDQGAGFTPNDIAVVVATGVISGSNISPGNMFASSANPGGNGWITGWGRTCG